MFRIKDWYGVINGILVVDLSFSNKVDGDDKGFVWSKNNLIFYCQWLVIYEFIHWVYKYFQWL